MVECGGEEEASTSGRPQVSTVAEIITVSDSEFESEIPYTCLVDAAFLSQQIWETEQTGGDKDRPELPSEEHEGLATQIHWVTNMLEKVSISEDGTEDSKTLGRVSFTLDGKQQYL